MRTLQSFARPRYLFWSHKRNVPEVGFSAIRFRLRCCRATRDFVLEFMKTRPFHREMRHVAPMRRCDRSRSTKCIVLRDVDPFRVALLPREARFCRQIHKKVAFSSRNAPMRRCDRPHSTTCVVLGDVFTDIGCGSGCSRRCYARGNATQCSDMLYYAI